MSPLEIVYFRTDISNRPQRVIAELYQHTNIELEVCNRNIVDKRQHSRHTKIIAYLLLIAAP